MRRLLGSGALAGAALASALLAACGGENDPGPVSPVVNKAKGGHGGASGGKGGASSAKGGAAGNGPSQGGASGAQPGGQAGAAGSITIDPTGSKLIIDPPSAIIDATGTPVTRTFAAKTRRAPPRKASSGRWPTSPSAPSRQPASSAPRALRQARPRSPRGHALLRCRLTLPGLTPPDVEAFVRSTGRPGEACSVPPLAQELAGALGGEIKIHTDVIRIKLPVDLVTASEEPTPPHDPVIVGLAPDQPSYRILVAEDRWQSRQLLVQMLARVGFDVREGPATAPRRSRSGSNRPQLIWMDMRMPGVTGLEATLRIKRSPGGKQTIVIALTASAFDEDPATPRPAGCGSV